MHSRGFLHRDLKPQNILMDTSNPAEPILKIGDFGLARSHGLLIPRLTHEVGSLHYRAPEILLGTKHYGTGIDTWSAGCIFGEMFTKVRSQTLFETVLQKTLFPGENEVHQLMTIFQELGTPSEVDWPELSQFDGW